MISNAKTMKKIAILLFLALVPLSQVVSQNILDFYEFFIKQEEDPFASYHQHKEKWICSIHGDVVLGATLLIDLSDYMGVTEEGQNGWRM